MRAGASTAQKQTTTKVSYRKMMMSFLHIFLILPFLSATAADADAPLAEPGPPNVRPDAVVPPFDPPRPPAALSAARGHTGPRRSDDAITAGTSWMPLFYIATWGGVDLENHITVTIVIPSGTCYEDNDGISVLVTPDGRNLQVTVHWSPGAYQNVEYLTAMYRDADNIARQNAMQLAIRGLRNNTEQSLKSVALIELPFEVIVGVTRTVFMRDSRETYVVLVDLDAPRVGNKKLAPQKFMKMPPLM